jgi:hypothetical protein
MKKENDDDYEDLFNEDETEDIFSFSADEELNKEEERKEKMKNLVIKTLRAIGIVIAIAFFGYFVISNSQKEKNQEKIEQEETTREEERLATIKSNFIQQYNAIDFKEKDFVFSEDIYKEYSKNFFFEGFVDDIYRKEEKRFIILSDYNYTGTFEISEEHVNTIRNQIAEDDSSYPSFFFIVEIDTASKLSFQTETDRDGEDVWVYTQPSNDFLLKGKVIDIKKAE